MLTPAQVQRYVRQLLLPEIGMAGQELLASARFELPANGLAADTARDYLTRAGSVVGSPAIPRASGFQFALHDHGFAWSSGHSPCALCLQEWLASLPPPPLLEAAALAMAAGALAASQLMLEPLGRLTGATPGHGIGFAFWPALLRQEVKSRPGCACTTVAAGG